MILFIISQIITYNADTIKYYPDKEILILIGNAEARYENLKVIADTMIYYINERKLVAISNPILYENEKEIKAEKMEYFIDERKGFAKCGKTKVEKGFFYGKNVVYLEEKILKIKNGYFTTCDKEEPHYCFFSPEIKVLIDERVIAKNVILLVKGIPIFYLPFWIYPTVKERRSGLLIPKIGFSAYGGNFIQNIGWYQTLSRYADATLWFDYYTSKGIWTHLEFRYLFKTGSGNIRFDYANERKGNKRWSVNGSGMNKLPLKINLSYFSDYRSDNKIDIDYNIGETKLQEEANAEITTSRSFSFGNISMRLKEKRDFINNLTKVELPRLDINFYGLNILGLTPNLTNFILRGSDGIVYSSSQTGFSISRMFFPFRFSFSLSLLHLFASRTLDSVYYHGFSRAYTFSIKTSIYGISNFGFLFVDRFRTVLDPYVNFSISEKAKEGNLPKGAPFSIPSSSSKNINYGINITNQWKIKEKVYSPFYLNIIGSYKSLEKKFSNLLYSFVISTTGLFRSDISGEYRLKERKLFINRITNSFNLNMIFEERPLLLNLTHSLTFQDTIFQQSAALNSSFHFTRNWKFIINTNYNFKDMRFNSTSVKIERDLHCWYLEISYSQYLSRWDYNFRVGVKNIPEVKIERNTIKGIFP